MSDLFGNHIVGFPTRRLIYTLNWIIDGKDGWYGYSPTTLLITTGAVLALVVPTTFTFFDYLAQPRQAQNSPSARKQLTMCCDNSK